MKIITLENGLEIREAFHESGGVAVRHNYKNGKLHGLIESFYESGAVKYRCNYKDGRLHGLAESFYKSGAVGYRENYKNGKLQSEYFQESDNEPSQIKVNK